MLFALIFFVIAEVLTNVHRLNSLIVFLDIDISGIILFSVVFFLVAFSSMGVFLYHEEPLTKANFFSAVLWFPYAVFFIILFSNAFPIENPQDQPMAGLGIILLGLSLAYSLSILLIIFMINSIHSLCNKHTTN